MAVVLVVVSEVVRVPVLTMTSVASLMLLLLLLLLMVVGLRSSIIVVVASVRLDVGVICLANKNSHTTIGQNI